MGDLYQRPSWMPADVTADKVRRAQLAVARAATDVDDCRTLLDALGLLPKPSEVTP